MRRAILLAAALALVSLVVASGYALARRHEDAEKRRRTLETLRELAGLITTHDLGETTVDIPPPRATGTREDPTGMNALHEWLMGGHYIINSEPGTPAGRFLRGDLAKDAWGRPIRYRCPGVRCKRGWDVSSLGPDGLDDQGEGGLVVGFSGDPAQVSSSSW